MGKKAPGKSHREGISFVKIMRMFPDNATAEAWFAKHRWPDGPYCPGCGSVNVQTGANHKTMPYRCREKGCRKKFSVRTGTVMEASNLGYQTWAVAIYLSLTSLKSVSSMKLHRDLEITQKSAWHLAHRLRTALSDDGKGLFTGPAEADETYMGGKRANMPRAKRKVLKGRGAVGKSIVAGVKDRKTNEVRAQVVTSNDSKTLQSFVRDHVREGAVIYTDEHGAYRGIAGFDHEAVNHSVGEYVRGLAHTQGIDSFWAALKRAHKGTFHKISPKHLDRYVQEFAGKHNIREADTLAQMVGTARAMLGKRLRYGDLIADNGLDSGARA